MQKDLLSTPFLTKEDKPNHDVEHSFWDTFLHGPSKNNYYPGVDIRGRSVDITFWKLDDCSIHSYMVSVVFFQQCCDSNLPKLSSYTSGQYSLSEISLVS